MSWPVLALLVSGCANLVPVSRYPYVEAHDLTLEREELHLTVSHHRLEVLADFWFVGDTEPERVMTFPIAAPGGPAQGFSARLGMDDSAPPLKTRLGAKGGLPAGSAVEQYDILIPEDVGRTQELRLRVRYVQPGQDQFAYVLKTGAYWNGPIQDLRVLVNDPASLLSFASVEGQPAQEHSGTTWGWRFAEVEPDSGVVLVTR